LATSANECFQVCDIPDNEATVNTSPPITANDHLCHLRTWPGHHRGFFRGLQRVELGAALTLLPRLFVFAFDFAALLLRSSVNSIASAYLIGNCLAALLGYIWLRRRFFKPVLRTKRSANVALLGQVPPLGGAILFSIVPARAPALR
jgi:O-antigen/teichoic acid export membrane protein